MAKFKPFQAAAATAIVVLAALAARPAMADDYNDNSDHKSGYSDEDCSSLGRIRLPGKNIVDVAVGNKNFSTLVTLLTSANLVTTLQSKGPFTVFAPTNDAFAKIPASVLGAIGSSPALLKAVLTYHVAAGRTDLRQAEETITLTTVQGEKVFARTTCKGGTTTLHINNSTVVIKPIVVDNGIIYAVDSVLLPQF